MKGGDKRKDNANVDYPWNVMDRKSRFLISYESMVKTCKYKIIRGQFVRAYIRKTDGKIVTPHFRRPHIRKRCN